MAGSVAKSWSLARASAWVLNADRKLLVFPLLSGAATALVTASFVVPLAVSGGLGIFEDGRATSLHYMLGFLFYLVQYVVIVFFNAALVGAALIRMGGGVPRVADGMRIAIARLPAILGYAALAATLGLILRVIAERAEWLGRLAARIAGMTWNLAAFLVVPVLVTQDVGPVDALRQSAALFRRTWGEQVVGAVGMGWTFGLGAIAWTLAMGWGFVALLGSAPSTAVWALAVWILGVLALVLLYASLRGIYTAALYRYATLGEAADFDGVLLAQAFPPKP